MRGRMFTVGNYVYSSVSGYGTGAVLIESTDKSSLVLGWRGGFLVREITIKLQLTTAKRALIAAPVRSGIPEILIGATWRAYSWIVDERLLDEPRQIRQLPLHVLHAHSM